ncbi:MAG: D-glycerate dehydrogenase [Chloroflexi bacterium]|nr:D-glycerate dehydrogenase [Chloroflexota bacterium]
MIRLPGRRSRPRVYVTRQLPGDALDRLREQAQVDIWGDDLPPPRDELLAALAEAEGLICLLTDNIDAGLLQEAPNLRAISTMAVGYDHIDIEAATANGVLVTHTPGVLTETTADFTFALLLSAARRLPEGERAVREGRWSSWSPSFLLGRDVHGATLGIVGLGEIGLAVARRARGFDMRVLYHSRTRKPAAEEELGCVYVGFDELLDESDFVSVHLPLTPETRHLFGDAAFERMKTTAIFVNTARGAVVDEAALMRALESQAIAGAAVDVAEVEPLPRHDPLLRLPNLLATPHIASASVATRSRMAEMAVDNLLSALAGETPAHCVNPQIIDT